MDYFIIAPNNNSNKIVILSTTLLALAKEACRNLGDDWKVTQINSGAIVCSKVQWLENCFDCDKWRLLVWVDGADEYSTKIVDNTTLAGNYYCGFYPNCQPETHPYGGRWLGISLFRDRIINLIVLNSMQCTIMINSSFSIK